LILIFKSVPSGTPRSVSISVGAIPT